MTNIISIQWCS